jgi:hypothetical protein
VSAQTEDRLVYTGPDGDVHCISSKALVVIPAAFEEMVATLCSDLRLARDCAMVFGGIPLPVAQAILRNMEPAHAAFDMAILNGASGERLGN